MQSSTARSTVFHGAAEEALRNLLVPKVLSGGRHQWRKLATLHRKEILELIKLRDPKGIEDTPALQVLMPQGIPVYGYLQSPFVD